MTYQEVISKFSPKLKDQFGLRESQNILRIMEEDYFSEIILDKSAQLSSSQVFELEESFIRVLRRMPVQYAISRAYFDQMVLKVSPEVLIPRPETEELLMWAKGKMINRPKKKYLDIGTGSGCLALGMKKAFPEATIYAMDKSEGALKIVRENSSRLNLELEIIEADILDKNTCKSFPQFDGIVSNPPYIPENEKRIMGSSVLKYEPEMALMVPDENPLLFYRAIADFAKEHLKQEAWLLLEINENFGYGTMELLASMGFENMELRKDISEKDRMIYCEKK